MISKARTVIGILNVQYHFMAFYKIWYSKTTYNTTCHQLRYRSVLNQTNLILINELTFLLRGTVYSKQVTIGSAQKH